MTLAAPRWWELTLRWGLHHHCCWRRWPAGSKWWHRWDSSTWRLHSDPDICRAGKERGCWSWRNWWWSIKTAAERGSCPGMPSLWATTLCWPSTAAPTSARPHACPGKSMCRPRSTFRSRVRWTCGLWPICRRTVTHYRSKWRGCAPVILSSTHFRSRILWCRSIRNFCLALTVVLSSRKLRRLATSSRSLLDPSTLLTLR